MKRSELQHILRAASRIVEDDEPLVLGSQAILGSHDEDSLPDDAVASIEADITYVDDPENTKSDRVDFELGEDSRFHETFGYYAQGVNVAVAVLPAGWQERLVALVDPESGAQGRCIEPHDLAISKLAAGRGKDHEFVSALIEAQLLDVGLLRERARYLETTAITNRVMAWLSRF